MISITVILIVFAVVCWLLAAGRFNLTALGLFFFGLSILLGSVKL